MTTSSTISTSHFSTRSGPPLRRGVSDGAGVAEAPVVGWSGVVLITFNCGHELHQLTMFDITHDVCNDSPALAGPRQDANARTSLGDLGDAADQARRRNV